jgi:hypothetical protein
MAGVLRYLIHHARGRFEPRLPAIPKVQNWLYKMQDAAAVLRTRSIRSSSTFLGRNKIANHEALYVPRRLDKEILDLLKAARPSKLEQTQKSRQRTASSGETTEVTTYRSAPPQICIVRDASGAGKTTLSVQLALSGDRIAVAVAARDEDSDRLTRFLEEPDEETVFQLLTMVDEPLVLVLDSLDEAIDAEDKKRQVISLVRRIDELNEGAREARGLLAFPIVLVTTIRDEYWEGWVRVFEGRNTVSFVRRLAGFSGDEAELAIERYEAVYRFALERPLTPEVRKLLSLPFDLQVFSEGSRYRGLVPHADILNESVLDVFFRRKKDDITRRAVPGLTGGNMMELISELAREMLDEGRHDLPRSRVFDVIKARFPILWGSEKEVLFALLSEQILTSDDDVDAGPVRFRHARFVEYLVAFKFLTVVQHNHERLRRHERQALDDLERLTLATLSSNLVSALRVHDAVRYLSASHFPGTENLIDAYYAQSAEYMRKRIRRVRAYVGLGDATDPSEIALIVRAVGSKSPEIAWEGFWVLAAKNNDQPTDLILDAFEVAWTTNAGRADRWTLLSRLASRGLLLLERSLRALASSASFREWEVFLGFVLEGGLTAEVREVWPQLEVDEEVLRLLETPGPDWAHAAFLLGKILNGEEYVLGEVSPATPP